VILKFQKSLALVSFLIASSLHAAPIWDPNPGSGDWNTAANWTPATVPNGAADTATFALSKTTHVSISANTKVNGITFTPAATNSYTITASPGFTLTVSGSGITNNSGIAQNFRTIDDGFGNFGTIDFFNSSTAGNANIFNGGLAFTEFFDRSSAGSATIMNDFGNTEFFDRSTAGSATISASDEGNIGFSGHSTAGSAKITSASTIQFGDSSTAGSATIESGSGQIFFDGSSKGGTAAIGLFGITALDRASILDISSHNAPGVTIGSIEGDANSFVFLGANKLTVGSNNLSTTFAGVIADNFFGNGDVGGSLTKIGSGTLDLTGVNTYTGNTHINGGVLQVDGSITSNTFVGRHGTLAGTGTVNGDVTNSGVVSPGDSPGSLTVNSYTQTHSGTLLIDIAGGSSGQFSVLDVLGNANLNGILDPMLLNGFIPEIGESFTFMEYASLTGAFSRIQNQTFDNGMEHWVVTYQPTFAILTAVAGPAQVPDQASTLLLLTLSLLGLVTYQQRVLRQQISKQS
jgi:autotransporter-associated beta strand protein